MQPTETLGEVQKREARILEVQMWRAEKMMAGEPVPPSFGTSSSYHTYTTSDELDFLNRLAHRNWGFFMKYSRIVLRDQRTYVDPVDVPTVKQHIENLIERFRNFNV